MSYTTVQSPQKLSSFIQAIARQFDKIAVHNPKTARWFCRLIPSHCPFERDIRCFGQVIVHIPPLCKLNPFYEQLMGLRFKALSYLADVCGDDITVYCR